MRALVIVAIMLGGCGVAAPADDAVATVNAATVAAAPAPAPSDPRILPIPPIPAALRGCWQLDDPDHRDAAARLDVGADRMIERSSWNGRTITATADFVQRVTPTQIEGRWSYSEGDQRATFATMLSLGPDNLNTPAGKLRLSEGDAGSRWYSRCGPRG